MAYRSVTFVLRRADGTPDPHGRITYALRPSSYDDEALYGSGPVVGRPGADGAGSVSLWVSEGNPTGSVYDVEHRPSGYGAESYEVTVPSGVGALTHQALRQMAPAASGLTVTAADTEAEAYPGDAVALAYEAASSSAVTWTATGLPAWLALTDNGDGTATVTGTAPADTEAEGAEAFTLIATAGGRAATATTALAVYAADRYVDAAAAPGGDGATPATAFDALTDL